MIVSTYQPLFAPFPAFFYKAHLSDAMVLLDDVQFPRGTTWINRNRFKNDQGTLWMTIPVWTKGLGLQKINEVRICYDGAWTRKHRTSLQTFYAHAPYFDEHSHVVQEMFSGKIEKLVQLNLLAIEYLSSNLLIDTRVVLQSDLGTAGRGDALLVEVCRELGASRYLAHGAAGKYLNARAFEEAGIELVFFAPPSPIYPQLWGRFIPHLSAFDLLFNCGPKSRDILCGSGRPVRP